MDQTNMHGTAMAELQALVRQTAHALVRRLPDWVRVDDLISAGYEGLLDASRRFRPERGRFFPYARYRIRGEMIDWLRRGDLMSKDARLARNRMERVASRLATELGREPEFEEIALELGLSAAHYEALRVAGATREISLEAVVEANDGQDCFVDGDAVDPCDAASEAEVRARTKAAIETLPERMRRVVVAHCCEGRMLREIGVELGVTESRVCQIFAEARMRLRSELADLAELPAPDPVH